MLLQCKINTYTPLFSLADADETTSHFVWKLFYAEQQQTSSTAAIYLDMRAGQLASGCAVFAEPVQLIFVQMLSVLIYSLN